jgi:hypothetical protein
MTIGAEHAKPKPKFTQARLKILASPRRQLGMLRFQRRHHDFPHQIADVFFRNIGLFGALTRASI